MKRVIALAAVAVAVLGVAVVSPSTANAAVSASGLSQPNGIAVASAASAAASLATPSAEDCCGVAVAGTPPSWLLQNADSYCQDDVENGLWRGTACFEPDGDLVWVYDARGDTYPADAYWENYLKDADGIWQGYRSGNCWNKLGHGHWGYCNKDFYENSTYPNADYGQGSGLRVWACGGPDGLCQGYKWVVNSF